MQAWLAGLLASLIPKLLEWLWKQISTVAQDQLAAARIKEHISATIKKYEDLVLKYDELADKQDGQLSPDQKDELRLEKIRLEENLFNGIGKH